MFASPSDLNWLTWRVLLAVFALTALLGAVMHRTRFCTMGAISDAVLMRDFTRARQWALAASVAMLGTAALAWAGLIRPADTIYATSRWTGLSALAGGALFGFGMVLASGCGARTLVRLGGGSLKALVVLLVMGLAAQATLRGITAVLRASTVDRVALQGTAPGTLGHWAAAWLNITPAQAGLLAALAVALPLLAWVLARPAGRRGITLLAGLGVGGVAVAMWWASGVLGYLPEHPETLEAAYLAAQSGRMEGLTFAAPAAQVLDWLTLFSDRHTRLNIGVASVAGVVAGAWAHAGLTGQFRWEGFRTAEDLANHLAGALLMGVGGVTAMGCTIGHGLSGLSVLSLLSFTALPALVLGAVAALRYQGWRLQRQPLH
ncbi:MAG: YeeE/YedE family protein [Comamonadaceae bacterium]|nr:YeeE/YedE family protein [Comamonadaceae bacterium]